jgi:hypothetical protein
MKEYISLQEFLDIFKSPNQKDTFEVFYNKAYVKSGNKSTKLSDYVKMKKIDINDIKLLYELIQY